MDDDSRSTKTRRLSGALAGNPELRDTVKVLIDKVSAQGDRIEFTHGWLDDITKDLKTFKEDVQDSVESIITNHNTLVDTVKR